MTLIISKTSVQNKGTVEYEDSFEISIKAEGSTPITAGFMDKESYDEAHKLIKRVALMCNTHNDVEFLQSKFVREGVVLC